MFAALRIWLVRRLLARLKTPRDVLRFAARRYAARVALVEGARSLTYAELGARVFRIARAWHGMGVMPGNGVAVQLPDGIHQIEARLAAAECGAVLTLLPPWSAEHEVVQSLRVVHPSLFIHAGRSAEQLAELRRQLPGVEPRALGGGQEEEWLAGGAAQPCAHAIDPNATASLGFTSGTTGRPKVLSATHAVYLTSLRLIVDHVGIAPAAAVPDTMLVGVPLTGAGSGVVLPTLLAGGALVIPPRHDAQALLESIPRHRVTRLFTTPSLLIDMLDHPLLERASLATLRNIIYGTEMMPVAKLVEALRRLGPILQQGYGSAEVLPPVSLLQPHQHMHGDRPAPRAVLMSSGRVVPGVSVRVVDEAGRARPCGEVGEVLVQSPTVFRGYWKRPDLSAAALRGGCLHTGDMGLLNADGELTLLGRKADLLWRGERVIYPRLVEELMHDHPAIKEACFVQRGPDVVMAFSLRQAWRAAQPAAYWREAVARHLAASVAAWQMPDDYVLFDELPRSPLGKVLRRELRELLAATRQPASHGARCVAAVAGPGSGPTVWAIPPVQPAQGAANDRNR